MPSFWEAISWSHLRIHPEIHPGKYIYAQLFAWAVETLNQTLKVGLNLQCQTERTGQGKVSQKNLGCSWWICTCAAISKQPVILHHVRGGVISGWDWFRLMIIDSWIMRCLWRGLRNLPIISRISLLRSLRHPHAGRFHWKQGCFDPSLGHSGYCLGA